MFFRTFGNRLRHAGMDFSNTIRSKLLPALAAFALFFVVSAAYFAPQFRGEALPQHDVIQYEGMAKDISDMRAATGEDPQWTGGMFGGIFTATEAAAVASLYVMFLGFFVYGTLRVRDLPAIFWNTVEQTAKVMFVIATAGFFQYVLLYTRIPQQAIAFMSTSFATAAPVLLLIIALLVLMGCFMEGTAILLITVPIFVPLAKSFGYDIVQLGIVMCISLAIGVLTPPVGLNLYVMSSITGEHVLAIAKEAVGYVLIMIIVAILVAFIPELSLGFAKWVP
mgnify:FL=1